MPSGFLERKRWAITALWSAPALAYSPLDPKKLATRVGSWLRAEGPDTDVVVSCRVRLARNVAGHPFMSRLGEEEAIGLAEDEAYLGARDLVVHAHLALGDLDAACSAVTVAGASEAAILEVGAALVPAGRQAEAKALMGPLCRKLEGDQATRCGKLLDSLGD